MDRSQECQIVVRYRLSETQEWPWSLTYEKDQPVLTITDMDDSSLGVALRAIAQAGRNTAAAHVSTPSDDIGSGSKQADRFTSVQS